MRSFAILGLLSSKESMLGWLILSHFNGRVKVHLYLGHDLL